MCEQASGSKFSDVNGTLAVLLAERGVREGKQTISDKVACRMGRALGAGGAECRGTPSRESGVCGGAWE